MRDEARLRAFLEALWAHPVPDPPVNETWKELIVRIKGGGVQRIDHATYWSFLESLPPHYHGGDFFAHCDGAEALRLFARKDGDYLCRQLTWDETVSFCELAGIDLPD